MTKLTDNEKLTFDQFAMMHDHTLLKTIFDKFDELGLLSNDKFLSDFYTTLKECKEIEVFVQEKGKLESNSKNADSTMQLTFFTVNEVKNLTAFFVSLRVLVNSGRPEIDQTAKPNKNFP